MQSINSLSYLNFISHCWHYCGIKYQTLHSWRAHCYRFYSIIVFLFITIGSPLHTVLGLQHAPTAADVRRDLSGVLAYLACSIKFTIYLCQQHRIAEMSDALLELDARVLSSSERAYYERDLNVMLRRIVILYGVAYATIFPTTMTNIQFGRRLLFHASLPFDWTQSIWHYMIALLYQIICLILQLVQTYGNDAFPVLTFCLLAGHLRLLCLRVAQLGYAEGRTAAMHETELKHCIRDQQRLYALYENVQQIVAWPLFVQFTVTALCLCVGIVSIMRGNTMDIMRFSFYIVAVLFQLFPICYFGTLLTYEAEDLHRKIYECNWTEQSRKFKKDLILFTELSLRKMQPLAGNMLAINLNTYISTLKGAYSLITVLSADN